MEQMAFRWLDPYGDLQFWFSPGERHVPHIANGLAGRGRPH
jgi:hypothetical protein